MADTDERMNPFSPVSKSEWLAKVEADLKGPSLDRLRFTTPGGLEVEPLYTAEDRPEPRQTLPGAYPYVRGSRSSGDWLLRQEYDDPRPSVCKTQIREDFERGAEALWLRMGPRHGCRILTIDELDALLEPVDLAATSVFVEGGSDTLAVAVAFLALADRRGVSHDSLRGGFAFDPIGLLASEGRIQGGFRSRLGELRDLASWCATQAPGLRAVHVSGDAYAGGGASTVQELAYTIATGIEYLRQLTNAGIGVDAAAKQIAFGYGVSADFFLQVAKLRAARMLWAKVVTASGGSPSVAAMHMHCRTSRFTKTKWDPWVNMLRVTAECTAAILGGADSIATSPFDEVVGSPDPLARRVARNTQVLLREESHLDQVADPAGGSWFVEDLTDELARAAWETIRSIEAGGGIVQALSSGTLVDAVGEVAGRRRASFATREAPIVGVSVFPHVAEQRLQRERVSQDEVTQLLRAALDGLDVGAYRDSLLSLSQRVNDTNRAPGALTEQCLTAVKDGTDVYSIAAVLQHGQPDFHVEPILRWRAAEEWEALRDRSHKCDEPPTAFLANLGPIPSHKARSTWAQNLLGAAGIDSSDNDGFDDAQALGAAWADSSTALAVVCGSDADYETMLEPAVVALKKAGCPLVLVAGRPGDDAGVLREAGVSDFLFVGCDVLQVMAEVLDALGVDR